MFKPVIITPTKNRAELLRTTLENTLSQNHKDFYVLVVDHNSTDGTKGVVESFKDPRVIYIHHVGYHDAAWSPKNEGLRNLPADTSGVLFKDDDDIYHSPESLGYLVDAAIRMGPRFGIVTGDYIEYMQNGDPPRRTVGKIHSTDEIADKCWFPVKASIFDINLVNQVQQLPPIRSRETILFAYFVVGLIEHHYHDKEIYYTGKLIVEKTRHENAISAQNVANGSRQSSDILFRNIHTMFSLLKGTGIPSFDSIDYGKFARMFEGTGNGQG